MREIKWGANDWFAGYSDVFHIKKQQKNYRKKCISRIVGSSLGRDES